MRKLFRTNSLAAGSGFRSFDRQIGVRRQLAYQRPSILQESVGDKQAVATNVLVGHGVGVDGHLVQWIVPKLLRYGLPGLLRARL